MICFCWAGLPQYAARCIGAFVRSSDERVVVIATRPSVPIEGMESMIPGGVVWVDENEGRSLADLCGEMPGALFVSGWCVAAFNRYRDEVRTAKGLVFAMSDGNAVSGFKTFVRALRFRLLLARKYDGYLVPGVSGCNLMRQFGIEDRLVCKGLYAADSTLFHTGKPLPLREKRMIFVGRFCPVKNVLRLCEAFRASDGPMRGWRLDLYGCGEQRVMLRDGQGVFVHDFLQPDELAVEYRKSRIFILPSIVEPWGLVVHEAALSGCFLLLSDCIGSGLDFVGRCNGIRFDPFDVQAMTRAMNSAFAMTDDELLGAARESVLLATENASLDLFVASCRRLLEIGRLRNVDMLGVADGRSIFRFMGWVNAAWSKAGGRIQKPHIIPRRIGALFARLGLSFRIFPSKRKLIVCGSSRFDSVAWPWCYFRELVPIMWDVWPQDYQPLVKALRRNRVRTIFCTSSQVADKLKHDCPSMKVTWLPEGIDTASYPKGCRLRDRAVDVLQYGRSLKWVMKALDTPRFNCHHNLVCSRGGLVFESFEELTKGIRSAKIVICFPQCDTNPKHAGDIETLTQRYWECMLSGTLIVGRAPAELVRICGFDPVVGLGEDPVAKIEEMLADIDSYQAFVDRNERFAREHADWTGRMDIVTSALYDKGNCL